MGMRDDIARLERDLASLRTRFAAAEQAGASEESLASLPPRYRRVTAPSCAPLTDAIIREAVDVYDPEGGRLQWPGTPYLSPRDAVRVAAKALEVSSGGYNAFRPSVLRAILGSEPVCVRFAREYSVAVYVRGPGDALAAVAKRARRRRVDEVSIQDDGDLRLWWD